MGTVLSSYGDAGYDHESYGAQILDDGSITGTYSTDTRPRMIGQLVTACGRGLDRHHPLPHQRAVRRPR